MLSNNLLKQINVVSMSFWSKSLVLIFKENSIYFGKFTFNKYILAPRDDGVFWMIITHKLFNSTLKNFVKAYLWFLNWQWPIIAEKVNKLYCYLYLMHSNWSNLVRNIIIFYLAQCTYFRNEKIKTHKD